MRLADRGCGSIECALDALLAMQVKAEHVGAIRHARTRGRRRRLILRLGADYIDPPILWVAVELLQLYGLPGPFEPMV